MGEGDRGYLEVFRGSIRRHRMFLKVFNSVRDSEWEGSGCNSIDDSVIVYVCDQRVVSCRKNV